MMLALGLFVFMRQTLPYQSMKRESNFSWASNARVGKRCLSIHRARERDY